MSSELTRVEEFEIDEPIREPADMTDRELLIELVKTQRLAVAAIEEFWKKVQDNPMLAAFL